MKLLKLSVSLLSFALLLCPFLAHSSSAAQQEIDLTPVPLQNSTEIQNLDPTYSSNNTVTQTGVTTDDWLSYYWTITLPTELPCPTASFTGLRIASNTTVQTEGEPDGVTMYLYKGIEGIPYGTPISGSAAGPGGIGRLNNDSAEYESSDLGIAGPLEAIWDISDYELGEALTFRISHDAEDGTVGEQTTINKISAIYDDASCTPQVQTPVSTDAPKTPKTGAVATVVVAASAAIAAILITLKSAKRLKVRH